MDTKHNIQKGVVLITGAGKGIGFELVKLFLTDPSFQVIGTSRNIKQLTQLQNYRLHIVQGDLLADYDQILTSIKSIKNPINIFINNAAQVLNKPLKDITNDEINQVMETNFAVPLKLIRDLIEVFVAGSHIVNISSMSGFQGSKKFNGLSLYSASKAALASLSECVAVELKEKQISCNCLALGAVETDMIKISIPGLKPTITSSQMAQYISDFARFGHRYYNGQVLPINLETL